MNIRMVGAWRRGCHSRGSRSRDYILIRNKPLSFFQRSVEFKKKELPQNSISGLQKQMFFTHTDFFREKEKNATQTQSRKTKNNFLFYKLKFKVLQAITYYISLTDLEDATKVFLNRRFATHFWVKVLSLDHRNLK